MNRPTPPQFSAPSKPAKPELKSRWCALWRNSANAAPPPAGPRLAGPEPAGWPRGGVLTSPPEAGPFPIIVMTSYGNEQLAVQAIKSGALDYVVKSPEAFADMPHTVARFYYRNYERQFRAEAERQLSAIAELKSDELAQYRKERLWDAATFFKNALLFPGWCGAFSNTRRTPKRNSRFRSGSAKYLATDQYDLVCLFDAQGVIRMSVPAGRPPISSFVSQRIPEVLRSGRVTFQDFHRNEHDQRVYLTLLVPILDESDTNRPLGVLALRIDPETYLYPFIQRWPTPSLTAETLLVRRDGNDALFLNELKFQTNTALNLRISLANTNVPAVKAVLGQEGIVEGTDYRGVPVLAALHAIPDSPWFLVARMDTAEVYAPMRRFYRAQYESAEALRRSETKFHTLYDSTRRGDAAGREGLFRLQPGGPGDVRLREPGGILLETPRRCVAADAAGRHGFPDAGQPGDRHGAEKGHRPFRVDAQAG
jgi:hypothetical protein